MRGSCGWRSWDPNRKWGASPSALWDCRWDRSSVTISAGSHCTRSTDSRQQKGVCSRWRFTMFLKCLQSWNMDMWSLRGVISSMLFLCSESKALSQGHIKVNMKPHSLPIMGHHQGFIDREWSGLWEVNVAYQNGYYCCRLHYVSQHWVTTSTICRKRLHLYLYNASVTMWLLV